MENIKYTISENLLKIYNTEQVLKKDALSLIKELRNKYPDYNIFKRSNKSLYNEFCVHKLFYILGIKKNQTIDADIQYPLTTKEKIVYPILGPISKLFIK